MIEGVEMAHSARHVEPNDPLGPRDVLGFAEGPRGERAEVVAAWSDWVRGSQLASAIEPKLTPVLEIKVRRPMGLGSIACLNCG